MYEVIGFFLPPFSPHSFFLASLPSTLHPLSLAFLISDAKKLTIPHHTWLLDLEQSLLYVLWRRKGCVLIFLGLQWCHTHISCTWQTAPTHTQKYIYLELCLVCIFTSEFWHPEKPSWGSQSNSLPESKQGCQPCLQPWPPPSPLTTHSPWRWWILA